MADGEHSKEYDPANELDKSMREIRNALVHQTRTTPLLEAALTAQTRVALEGIARSARFTPDVSQALDESLRRLSLFPQLDQSALSDQIRRFVGSEQLLDSIQRNFAPKLPSITNAKDYGEPSTRKQSGYSTSFNSPSDYFAKDEVVISSVTDLNSAISKLIEKAPNLQLVWRGQRDESWGLHSSLWRRLQAVNDVKPASSHPSGRQPFHTEDQLIAAERRILETARMEWRFDGMSALETFARLQHFGGPTRLIDVTFNPFIATWFAVDPSPQEDGKEPVDARLFAFATSPVPSGNSKPSMPSRVELDTEWGARNPAWHAWTDNNARQSVEWGTGAIRRLWTPPAYEPRIPAQNAAFLLDGAPPTEA